MAFCYLSKRQCRDAKLRRHGSHETSLDNNDPMMTLNIGGGWGEVTLMGLNDVALRKCPE